MQNVSFSVYDFEELDGAAQEHVFNQWKESDYLEQTYYREIEELDTHLNRILDDLGIVWKRYGEIGRYGNLDYIWFNVRGNYNEEPRPAHVDDDGDITSVCMCGAFNAHTDTLNALWTKCENAPDDDTFYDLQDAYLEEYQKALDDLASAYRAEVDSLFDYYYCKEGAREYWEDFARWDWAEGGKFDRLGNDITGIITMLRHIGEFACLV